MAGFWEVAALVLLAVIWILTIGKKQGDFAIVLSIGVCAMLAVVTMQYLEPVVAFVRRLQQLGGLDMEMVRILLKAVGIALTAEIAGLICSDAGNAAMGKSLQLLAAALILYLSLPMLTALLELVEEILGSL